MARMPLTTIISIFCNARPSYHWSSCSIYLGTSPPIHHWFCILWARRPHPFLFWFFLQLSDTFLSIMCVYFENLYVWNNNGLKCRTKFVHIVRYACNEFWLVSPNMVLTIRGGHQSQISAQNYCKWWNCHDNERTVKETMATNWHKSSYIWLQMWWWSDLPHRMISCRFGIIGGNKAFSFVTIKITSSELIGDIIAHLQSAPR